MSYRDTADFLGITVGTLYSMVARGMIPHHRVAPRLVRFNRTELENWLANNAVAARKAVA